MRKALRWFRRIVLTVLALVVVAIAAVVIALHTDWGREKVRAKVAEALADQFPGAQVGKLEGSIFGERPARFENHVSIDKEVKDAWGIPVLHVDVKDGDNEHNMAKDAANTMEEIFTAAKWDIVAKTDKFFPPGYSIHELGTCRMGDDPKTSVLNKWCQSHDIKNLFVVDGSSFVSSGWQNPTMTILALAMRSSEYLAEQMRQGNV